MNSRVARIARSIFPAPVAARLRRTVLHRKPRLAFIEVLVVNHCNLSCRACNAWSPLSKPSFTDPEEFDRDVTRLGEMFSEVEHFGIVGGEPLLHPRVLDFPRSVRRVFAEADVYLVSNGLLMHRMPDSFFVELAALDVRLVISAYPVELDRASIVERCSAHGVRLEFTEARAEFWTFPVRREGDCDPKRSFAACRARTNCPMIASGRIYTCGRAGLAHIFEANSGWSLPRTRRDFVDLYAATSPFDIIEYLNRPIDWCRYCDVEHVRTLEWSQGCREYTDWT